MITKDQASALREKSGDRAVFTELLNSDPEFKAGVDRVRARYPELSGFEEAKFPSAMLDLYTGKKAKKTMDTAAELLVNATKAKSPSMQSIGEYAAETAGNIIPSTARLIGGVAQAVTHPIETGKTVFKLGVGGAANTLESIAGLAGVKNPEEIFNLESEEVASAVGDFYVQRYGSLEAAATTLRDDPAGFLSDLGAVVTGVGGILKGGAGALGAATGAATKTSTKLTSLGRGIRAAQSVGSRAIKTGINMEPLVITGKGVLMAGRGVRSIIKASGPTAMTERLISSSLKLHPNQLSNFEKFNGESAAQFMIRKGILSGGDEVIDAAKGVQLTGSNPFGRTRIGMVDDLERIAKKAKNTVDTSLAGVRQTYDLLDDAPEVLKALSEIEDTAKTYGLMDDLEFVRGMIEKERLSLSDINAVKRRMDDLYNLYTVSNEPSASLIAERLRRIRKGMKEFIEVEAEKKGLPDIGVLNEDTQKATALLKYAERAAMTGMGRNVISLADIVTGSTAFGLTRDPLSSVGIVVARRVLDSAPFKMTIAKFLNRLTKSQVDALLNAVKTGRHTKETRTLLRKVVAQTADDLQNSKVAEQENRFASLTDSRSPLETQPKGTPDSSLPVNPEQLPKVLPPSEGEAPFSALGEENISSVARIAYDNVRKNGGVTINLNKAQPKNGFAYSPSKKQTALPTNSVRYEDYVKFVKENWENLVDPNNNLGIWESEGSTYFDISRVGKNIDDVVKEAQKSEQLAIYDIEKGMEISTGKIENNVYTPIVNEEISRSYRDTGKNAGASGEGSMGSATEVSKNVSGGVEEIVIEPTKTNTKIARQSAIVKSLTKEQKGDYLNFKKKFIEDENVFNESLSKVIETVEPDYVLGLGRKSDARAIEKAFDDYRNGQKIDFSQVKDANRDSLVYSDPKKMAAAYNAIKNRFKIIGVKDRITRPQDGYRDIKINVDLGNTTGEIQLQFPAIAKAKETEHLIYQDQRTTGRRGLNTKKPIITKKEREALKQMGEAQQKSYGAAWDSELQNNPRLMEELEDLLKQIKIDKRNGFR